MDKKRILIADDELFIRLLVRSAMGSDYTVLEAGDGEEAMDVTHAHRNLTLS